MSGYTEDRLVEQPATQLMQHGLETLLRGPWEKGRLRWVHGRVPFGYPAGRVRKRHQ